MHTHTPPTVLRVSAGPEYVCRPSASGGCYISTGTHSHSATGRGRVNPLSRLASINLIDFINYTCLIGTTQLLHYLQVKNFIDIKLGGIKCEWEREGGRGRGW